jgi:hypothetical protein
VIKVDANTLRRVLENAVWRAAVCLEWTEAASNTNCNYEVPMVLSADSLRHLTAMYLENWGYSGDI